MFKLTVPNVETRIFYAYWYGSGKLESVEQGSTPNTQTYTVVYDDEFYAQYQADRFASGLYFAKVEKVEGA
jgi:hypothetical protein